MKSRLFTLLTIAGWLAALQSALGSTESQAVFETNSIATTPSVRRVAIVGAGSGGSSTAYYLRRYADEEGIAVNITVYDRNAYIGGRSTTVYAYDDYTEPVELGASIFVSVNYNLVNATREFNLSTSSFSAHRASSLGPELGVWDGTSIVVTTNSGWWDTAKLFWRYGLAPLRTLNLMKSTLGRFLQMYEKPYFPFRSLSQVTYDLDLVAVTAATGQQYLRDNKIADLFASEIVQASTRVNYAQDLAQIHGLEAMVCMATEGAMAIDGGNWQIFAGMLTASGAETRLERLVTGMEKQPNGSYLVHSHFDGKQSSSHAMAESEMFDEVVLAGPAQFSGIKFRPEPQHKPDKIPYVRLHVTLFTSKHLLSPTAFNLPAGTLVPQVLLTTLPATSDNAALPEFLSISLLRPTTNPRRSDSYPEYIYKIFSMAPINSTFLSTILGLGWHEPEQPISKHDVSWTYRKVWDSYPYEYPRVTFEELKLDDRLWYTSGIESFISTMETSSLMGMNVARLMVDEWIEQGI